jgi:hypothetical protein
MKPAETRGSTNNERFVSRKISAKLIIDERIFGMDNPGD